jgi:hypothetical protein
MSSSKNYFGHSFNKSEDIKNEQLYGIPKTVEDCITLEHIVMKEVSKRLKFRLFYNSDYYGKFDGLLIDPITLSHYFYEFKFRDLSYEQILGYGGEFMFDATKEEAIISLLNKGKTTSYNVKFLFFCYCNCGTLCTIVYDPLKLRYDNIKRTSNYNKNSYKTTKAMYIKPDIRSTGYKYLLHKEN